MDCSWGDSDILSNQNLLSDLPTELIEVIRNESNPTYLEALAIASLDQRYTIPLFIRYNNIFPELVARWISSPQLFANATRVSSAFARIIPFAPQLSIFAEECFSRLAAGLTGLLPSLNGTNNTHLSEDETREHLLAIYRLLLFDSRTFAKVVIPSRLQYLLHHDRPSIRYLAVRTLSLYMNAADAATTRLVGKYVGDEAVRDTWEGRTIDYGFLTSWENKRSEEIVTQLKNSQKNQGNIHVQYQRTIPREAFNSDRVEEICGILLLRAATLTAEISSLVETVTVNANLTALASALQHDQHILLTGMPGSGKTSLIAHVAKRLGRWKQSVKLHLNDQTDAKLLIGVYTTGDTPGSFKWQPGVLTTAVKEGRWVILEDIDKAPTGVMSVILPLLERNELFIQNQGQYIRAPRGFKIIATMRTSMNSRGEERLQNPNILGRRLWSHIRIQIPSPLEIEQIIRATYPLLHVHLPMIMDVFDSVREKLKSGTANVRTSVISMRIPDIRDLLKWCCRLNSRLLSLGAKSGREAIPEGTLDDFLLDAISCFTGNTHDDKLKDYLSSEIAGKLNVSPQRLEYCLRTRIPEFIDGGSRIRVGRVILPKSRSHTRHKKNQSTFAMTSHALRLLEDAGAAVEGSEPVLLVGETGIGKTTIIQELASLTGHKLFAVNLSQQSESGDLLGGFKPINPRQLIIPLQDELRILLEDFKGDNTKYLDSLKKNIQKERWNRVLKLWREALTTAERTLGNLTVAQSAEKEVTEHPKKRRKLDSSRLIELKARWAKFAQDVEELEVRIADSSKSFAFSFQESELIKAVRRGDWVLLDEINLAPADTLESISDLLQGTSDGGPSILLSETGSVEIIKAHPDFRIFGSMNPATDAGKRDLPLSLRSRFTEIFVQSPDRDRWDLEKIIKSYLKDLATRDAKIVSEIANLYLDIKDRAQKNQLADGAGQKVHFSLRSLTRTLSYAYEIAGIYGLRRSLHEGFSMSFLTVLNRDSESRIRPLLDSYLLGKQRKSALTQTPRIPDDASDQKQYIRFMHYWMPRGQSRIQDDAGYIKTPYVERNLLNLVRASLTRRYPILIQGPTSSGKTSMIKYLAKISGHECVRINNHEHTDLQEYLGSYVSDISGTLRFQEGLLVEALRKGHWIILDELNLAPTDVLEALNRLLDDNRELLIPETQEVVRPHPNFVLFATQNPAGLYGGRKVLSRAFRNRFLELHFDDIPEDELTEIITKRAPQVAPSYCKKIVNTYKELALLRQSTRLFEQKNSFATLRDLFRWAFREANGYDQLAVDGFMLLAERVRKPEERLAVKVIIEKVMKPGISKEGISEKMIYATKQIPQEMQQGNNTAPKIVWTKAMRRLCILVRRALENNEPVLLVGETGCGKTSICQAIAQFMGKELFIVNAHKNTETGDLIGAQRPIRNRSAIDEQLKDDLNICLELSRDIEVPTPGSGQSLIQWFNSLSLSQVSKLQEINKNLIDQIQRNTVKSKALFEWADGSLVQAMKAGQHFLLDEISLADDSVLERLNSVLELPDRDLLLAEKGPVDSYVKAIPGFQFLATMNPGGDYGKRELSAALRNRFTEIWVPPLTNTEDLVQIVQAKIDPSKRPLAKLMVKFAQWYNKSFNTASKFSISIRDLLAWVGFINSCEHSDPLFGVVHGAATVYIDTIGANPAALLAVAKDDISSARQKCLQELSRLLKHDADRLYHTSVAPSLQAGRLSFGSFSINVESELIPNLDFQFEVPSTASNAMRVVRALQLRKPILLEGSPGVGKTTLVEALAKASGKALTRINLSEQTDLMDLFGSDVPVEGADVGVFSWRDASFLQALKNGDWVLLDEMNLASQSVLEGLNACLDHRGEVYISELGLIFKLHSDFRLFAAQNPHHQGGGRKGLPASFVNRFTVVYADAFKVDDLLMICQRLFPTIGSDEAQKAVNCITVLDQELHGHAFGNTGGPWEVNLRDLLRWLKLSTSKAFPLAAGNPQEIFEILIKRRFRTRDDQQRSLQCFSGTFGKNLTEHNLYHQLGLDKLQVGLAELPRNKLVQFLPGRFPGPIPCQLEALESLMVCVQQNWPCILVGPSGSGKTMLIKYLASALGADVVEFAVNSEIDTMDLIGGYDQVDRNRQAALLIHKLKNLLQSQIIAHISSESIPDLLWNLYDVVNGVETECLDWTKISEFLTTLLDTYTTPELLSLQEECQAMILKMATSVRARFEWTDGILIRAIQNGQWLIVDHANLCDASVLDRLNSLLEPNGQLIVNENHNADGSTRIVKPHPQFRIFMTMDPRYGELSRAMRNRGVEVFLPSFDDNVCPLSSPKVSKPIESQLSRFDYAKFLSLNSVPQDLIVHLSDVIIDHLSISDLALISRWNEEISGGLIDGPVGHLNALKSSIQRYIVYFLQNNGREHIMQLYLNSASNSPLIVPACNDLPIHPFSDPFTHVSGRNSDLINRSLGIADLKTFSLTVLLHSQILASVREGFDSPVPSIDVTPLRLAISKPSTASTRSIRYQLLQFLTSLHQIIGEGLQVAWTSNTSQELISLHWAKPLLSYWRDIFNLSISPKADDGTIQIYLSLGQDLKKHLNSTNNESHAIAQRMTESLDLLRANLSLSTGLSMERIWNISRPAVLSSMDHLQSLLDLEKLADRFDSIMWRVNNPMTQLLTNQMTIAQALQDVRFRSVDIHDLIKTLESTMTTLESDELLEPEPMVPFFSEQFEGICQYYDLVPVENDCHEFLHIARLLSCRPTQSLVSPGNSAMAKSFTFLSRYSTSSNHALPLQALRGTLPLSLFQRVTHFGDLSLKRLSNGEQELEAVGKCFAFCCNQIGNDQVGRLNAITCVIFREIIHAHEDLFNHSFLHSADAFFSSFTDSIPCFHCLEFTKEAFSSEVSPSHYFLAIVEQQLNPCLQHLSNSRETSDNRVFHSAAALVLLSTACLLLFVPDKMFDPSLRALVERQHYRNQRRELDLQFTALQFFEAAFTGQNTNLRCQLVEDELQRLGDEPVAAVVVRPETSNLRSLQGDLLNVLKSVVQRSPSSEHLKLLNKGNSSALQECKLLRSNITQVTRRLIGNYPAYEDIIFPLQGMLQCLDLGLTMACLDPDGSNPTAQLLQFISSQTPFFGATPQSLLKSMDDGILPVNHTHGKYSEFILTIIAVANTIQPGLLSKEAWQQKAFQLFHTSYTRWKDTLESDQKRNAEQTSMYRYRDPESVSDEQQEEEVLQELFPTFEEVTKPSAQAQPTLTDPKNQAIAIAKAHASLFLETLSKPSLKKLLDSALKHLDTPIPTGTISPVPAELFIPSLVLALVDASQSIASSPSAQNPPNFYLDPNIPEAGKLLQIVQDIRKRFSQIQKAWPEHATLHDVIKTCCEIMVFRHVEPIAKFITKVEKLHGYVNEWQTVSSKEFSAADCYDKLTSIIVSWRRLELSSWARLLDRETETCVEASRAWWYVAYEAIIATPLSLEESNEEFYQYPGKLLSTLEAFLHNTSLGQYSARLKLLEAFKNHSALIIASSPATKLVHHALANFLAYFKSYEVSVEKVLSAGRATLEKALKEVLLLASWKDININALRDSAKRSHYKLTKIVRKYRALLGQSCETILAQRLPDLADDYQFSYPQLSSPSIKYPNEKALALCRHSVPGWDAREARFVNVSATIQTMIRISQGQISQLETPSWLDSFSSGFVSDMNELKTKTPNTATKENESDVKHLKTQKRKLFSDTLKSLRKMGIQYHLGTEKLDKQASLALVLAHPPGPLAMDTAAQKSADSYLHRILNFMSQVREAGHKHSGDLTSSEANRCVGYAEDLLDIIMRQRNNSIGHLGPHLTELEECLGQVENFCMPSYDISKHTLQLGNRLANFDGLLQTIRWLPPILELGSTIIQAHEKLSHISAQKVLDGISQWRKKFISWLVDYDKTLRLPSGIISSTQVQQTKAAQEYLHAVKVDLEQWMRDHPLLQFALKQILEWTYIIPCQEDRSMNGIAHISPEEIFFSIQGLLNMVLVTLQQGQRIQEQKLVPKSAEDKAWLVDADSVSWKVIQSFHISNIIDYLQAALQQVMNIGSDNGVAIASAIFASALPILQQYLAICRNAFDRYCQLHRSTCKMTYILVKSFVEIASQGFCTPQEESSEKGGDSGELEDGTGLGEGEGAENISKDIQEDEDLSELAQQQGEKGKQEDVSDDDDDDAIDMDHEEMAGETEDVADKEEDEEKGSENGESDEELDSEVGQADDLDAGDVDEKLWDGSAEEANDEKDKENDKGVGQKNEDKQRAGENDAGDESKDEEGQEEPNDSDDAALEGEDQVGYEEPEQMDPHTQEEEALELPDEIQLDGDNASADGDESDDGMSGISDIPADDDQQDEPPTENQEDDIMDDVPDSNAPPETTDPEENGEVDDNKARETDENEEAPPEDNQTYLLEDQADNAEIDPENAATSDNQAVGAGLEEPEKDEHEQSMQSKSQDKQGAKGEAGELAQQSLGSGDEERDRQVDEGTDDQREELSQPSEGSEAFKKLGDILEQWHRQQQEIQEASSQERENKVSEEEIAAADDMEFEHLPDNEAEADTQALGAATEDQAKAVDENFALDDNAKNSDNVPNVDMDEVEHDTDVEMDDIAETDDRQPGVANDEEQKNPGAVIGENIQSHEQPQDEDIEMSSSDSISSVDNNLSTMQLAATDSPTARSLDSARELWTKYENLTHDLSLGLTEQLRLILAPTLATKMRGDFRTGKRLNIKRIIPYIASQYKRDKIWMRRSVPSKRAYQILLAVDDSKSMAESGAHNLAFETLALVSKSLSMLEVGELCIVEFGGSTDPASNPDGNNNDNSPTGLRIAHPFDKPFTSEAGVNVFQHFTFTRTGTDILSLLTHSLSLLRTARATSRTSSSSTSTSTSLWQLELIISDGNFENHDRIKQLLLQAQEERVMVVFVVVGSSILDLKLWEPGKGLRRYLDSWPFAYWIVVEDVRELPGVLAGALRQWFGEVAESEG
ncbi:MAG: hypothetical protein M1834_002443 [Cirrosporium novae-zelandiae]|nr:MAG: hypothetical protein M1834_002443 [Cirrosporium novae-zelandiae]